MVLYKIASGCHGIIQNSQRMSWYYTKYIVGVFPRVIARAIISFFRTKRGRLFEGERLFCIEKKKEKKTEKTLVLL